MTVIMCVAKLLSNDQQSDRKKVVLVYYVGGVTYAEISALRYLSSVLRTFSLTWTALHFIVATTQFINGNKMVDAFKDEQGNLLNPDSLMEIY